MKEFTVRIADDVFAELNTEAFTIAMAYPEGKTMTQLFLVRCMQAWSNGEVPELIFNKNRTKHD